MKKESAEGGSASVEAAATQKDEAGELKACGNAAFGSGKYAEAAELYTKAIALDPRNHIYYGNRSATRTCMRHFDLALEDACAAIELKPDWPKAYYHHGRAMRGLGAAEQARNSFATALGLDPANASYTQLFEEAEKACVEGYYDTHIGDTLVEGAGDVQVRYTPGARGKGVHSTRSYSYGESVFVEVPLVCHRFVASEEVEEGGKEEKETNTLPCCSHCLRTHIPADKFSFGKELYEELYPSPPSMTGEDRVECSRCGTVYCSDKCRDAASAQYHRLLCVGSSREVAAEGAEESALHPFLQLSALARRLGRTNPLVIARSFAIAAQSLLDDPKIGAKKAWQPFSSFMSHKESHPRDEEAFDMICELLQRVDGMSEVLSIDNYRRLNGAINRNAQTICPVSDFHDFLVNQDMDRQDDLLSRVNECIPEGAVEGPYTDVYQFLGSSSMSDMLISGGSGMYSIANCMNHSCAPNVTVASCFPDYRIRILAISDISEGDELCFSYVDEDMPYAERQRSLQEHYHFKCECKKCLMDKPFSWV